STSGRGSSGPMSSARPSTVIQLPALLATTVVAGRTRRLASLRLPPTATHTTVSASPAGWRITPALTTDAWTVPSSRVVAMTQKLWSAPASCANSASVRLVTCRRYPTAHAAAVPVPSRRGHHEPERAVEDRLVEQVAVARVPRAVLEVPAQARHRRRLHVVADEAPRRLRPPHIVHEELLGTGVERLGEPVGAVDRDRNRADGGAATELLDDPVQRRVAALLRGHELGHVLGEPEPLECVAVESQQHHRPPAHPPQLAEAGTGVTPLVERDGRHRRAE